MIPCSIPPTFTAANTSRLTVPNAGRHPFAAKSSATSTNDGKHKRLAVADSAPSIPAGISIAPALNLPLLEDANSIQFAIMQVLQLLLTGQLEHRTAALAFYGLKTATINLRRTKLEPYPRDVVVDLAKVDQTLLGEDIWKNSDFTVKEEEEDEEEIQDEGHNEHDENDSLEEAGVPAPQDHSAATDPANESDSLPTDWRSDVRTKIAARVQHAALQGDWINQLISSPKSP